MEDYNGLSNLTSVLEKDSEDFQSILQKKETWLRILVLTSVFCLGAFENICFLISITKTIRRRSSPMYILLLHLGIGDALVVFSIIPSEIFWRIFKFSFAGDFFCKVFHFLRGVSLNLSSFIMICISIDRFYAVICPLMSIQAPQRIKHMVFWAWFLAIVAGFPQLLVFRMDTSATSAASQCRSKWMGRGIEIGGALFQLTCQYFVTFLVLLYTYTKIFHKVSNTNVIVYSEANTVFLRRAGQTSQTVLDNAKMNTVRLTLVMVVTFVICRFFYAVMTLWTLFDEETANNMVNPYLKDILYHTVVFNTCVNALIYGIYTKNSTDPSRISTSANNTIEIHNLNSVYLNRESRRKHSL